MMLFLCRYCKASNSCRANLYFRLFLPLLLPLIIGTFALTGHVGYKAAVPK